MVTYENVVTLDSKEIKALSFDSVKYDASTVSHIVKIAKIAKALTDEVEKYKSIVKAHEQELTGNKLVSVKHSDTPYFSKDEFIAVYGEDEYARFCVIKDRRTVEFNG